MLSASTLKLLACLFMLIDHVGVRLFPGVLILRIIGRLAYPLFAFFIAEGCRYTRNRLKHFLSVFILGVICESVYIIYMGGWYGNILLTFSASILLTYMLQWCRKKKSGMAYAAFAMLLGSLAVATRYVNFDYGFTGIIAPLFAAWPGDRWNEAEVLKPPSPGKEKKLLYFAYGIMLTARESAIGWIQLFALLTIPLLCLYNGKAGSRKLKYFFYIFYPVHLLLIELTAMII